uniref:Uncharacterized protein n=1 Tax=Pristionchus pacificus TaxID=54126 RepID=A0A2A6BG45_PRIPA|eukprot:PDM64843.1 hypothetical protein PRIPAC_53099 [Pristionchus pacificus]
MLGCLKSCIRHPKEKREKVRPGKLQKPESTVSDVPTSLSPRFASKSSLGNCGERVCERGNVVLECTAPIVVEETSRIEDDTKAEETEDEVEEEPARKVMGMTEESAIHAELASATVPKERKFQVVRVPGVFTRGRWKCWDYRDDVKPIEGLTFTDDKENDSAGTVPVAPSTSVSTTVSEPANNSSLREESSTIVVTSIAPAPPTPQHGTPDKSQVVPTTVTITSTQPQQPVTDTVVVQSIAPPATQEQQPIVVVVPAPPPIPPSPSLSTTTTSSIVVVEEPPPRRELQQQPPSGESMTVSMTSSETGGTPSIGGVGGTRRVAQADGRGFSKLGMEESGVSTVSIGSGGGGAPPSLSSSVSPPFVPTATPSPEMTRSGSEAAAPATPAAAAAATAAQVDEEPAASVPAMSNAAAIDNKIEQAMDLVKTHLTFAVREEVEILRTTIAELESRVTTLETQNTYLKRHVTPEVMSNLPGMVHQHKMSLPATAQPVMPLQQVPAATSAPSTTVSPSLAAAVLHEQQQQAVLEAAAAAAATISPPRAAAAPPPSPAAAAAATTSPSKPYCPATTNFVNSLNTVVNSPPNPR